MAPQQYLKITSNSRTNAVDMFTLGVSTARGVDGKIGQFGSGSLMSTLLWLRRYGVSPVYVINGVCVTFSVREEKTSDGSQVFHRVYQSTDGVEVPLSVALEYGELDWSDFAMSLREWICNALDQGGTVDDVISRCSADDIQAAMSDVNTVNVYVPMNVDVRKYWQCIDDMFLHYSDRQNDIAIAKEKPSPCRLYRKGVFVRQLDDVVSLFDYNLNTLSVNECRTGSSDSMVSSIKEVLHGENIDVPASYFETIFQAIIHKRQSWEIDHPSSWLYSAWIPVLKAAAESGVRILRDGARDGVGYRIHPTWYGAFTSRCPELAGYTDKFAADEDIIVQDMPLDDSELTDDDVAFAALAARCWNFLSLLIPNDKKTMPTVHRFKTSDGSMPRYLGRYDAKLNRVFIWQDQSASVQTMLEEMAHAISGERDCCREFQEYLFRCLTECMSIVDAV